MENNEFFRVNEYKGSTEHTIFKLEDFKQKENVNFNESKKVNEDNKIENQKDNKKKDNNDNKKKSLSDINDKISQVTSNVASTVTSAATVGVVAVTAIITIAMADPPKVDIKTLEVGNDYVKYAIETSNYTDGITYKIEISNPSYFVSFDAIEGLNENVVTGLTPYREYTLSLTGYDEENSKATYYSKTIYTSDSKNPRAVFNITSFFNEELGATMLHYDVYVSDYYNTGSNFSLVVSDEKDNTNLLTDTNIVDSHFNSKTDVIPVNKDLKLEVFADVEGSNISIGSFKYRFDSLLQKPDTYLATFDTPTLDECSIYWGTNEYEILFPMNFKNTTNYDFYYKIILYDDEGYYEEIIGNSLEEIALVDNSHTYIKVKYQPLILLEGAYVGYEEIQVEDKYEFKPGLKIKDYYVDYYNASFIVDLEVRSTNTWKVYGYTSIDTTPIQLNSSLNYLSFPEEETTYYIYLEDDMGQRYGETIELKAIAIEESYYNFSYLNPSECPVTYNDNGSYNIYLHTGFETEDPDLYWDVKYGSFSDGYQLKTSKEPIMVLENLRSSTSLTYRVLKEVDGLKHVFKSATPSGAIEDMYMFKCQINITEEEGVLYLNVSILDSVTFDKESGYIELNDGSTISIGSDAYVYNADAYSYDLKHEIPYETEYAIFHFMGSEYADNLSLIEGIIEIKGSIYKEMTLEVSK